MAHFNPATRSVHLPHLPFDLGKIERTTIIACGTSYHAGLIAKYWIEQIARVPCDVDIASEFRYRAPDYAKGRAGAVHIAIAARPPTRWRRCVSQIAAATHRRGGEPAGKLDRARGRRRAATLAGPEIGVASTKAFTTQLVVLACLAIALARARGKIDKEREAALSTALTEVPSRASEVLNHDSASRRWPRGSPRRAMCFISAAARPSRSRSKAR